MKIINTIKTKNGKINVYDNDLYLLRKRFSSYKSLLTNKEDLIYDLVDSGFIIKKFELCLGVRNNKIVFYLDISMRYLK